MDWIYAPGSTLWTMLVVPKLCSHLLLSPLHMFCSPLWQGAVPVLLAFFHCLTAPSTKLSVQVWAGWSPNCNITTRILGLSRSQKKIIWSAVELVRSVLIVVWDSYTPAGHVYLQNIWTLTRKEMTFVAQRPCSCWNIPSHRRSVWSLRTSIRYILLLRTLLRHELCIPHNNVSFFFGLLLLRATGRSLVNYRYVQKWAISHTGAMFLPWTCSTGSMLVALFLSSAAILSWKKYKLLHQPWTFIGAPLWLCAPS